MSKTITLVSRTHSIVGKIYTNNYTPGATPDSRTRLRGGQRRVVSLARAGLRWFHRGDNKPKT